MTPPEVRDLIALAQQAASLPTADKLKLAALLLEAKLDRLAEVVGRRAVEEIELARLLKGEPA